MKEKAAKKALQNIHNDTKYIKEINKGLKVISGSGDKNELKNKKQLLHENLRQNITKFMES